MSNIYIQEPPTHGKVLLETTVGDIDVELWSREAPKACRNFIQLCLEGYYDKCPFHRLVKGFIVQGGDPTGTGTGGNSVWGKPFKDEFHSRLRFNRRGLVAMANAGRDDNGSQFFFTLAPTPELQNKHTIFAKVAGNTIYNMIKLEEGEVDQDERPLYPHKILKTRVLSNPFPDIEPRQSIASLKTQKKKPEKNPTPAAKNFSLLSFGEEAEEEEEELQEVNKLFSSRGKSSHDIAGDPKLSSELAVVAGDLVGKSETRSDQKDSLSAQDQLDLVKEKLRKRQGSGDEGRGGKSSRKKSRGNSPVGEKGEEGSEDEGEQYYLGKADKEAQQQRISQLRQEYKSLRREMRGKDGGKIENEALGEERELSREESLAKENPLIKQFFQEQDHYKKEKEKLGSKESREAKTLALLKKFQSKIQSAKDSAHSQIDDTERNEESGKTEKRKDSLKDSTESKGVAGDEDEEPLDPSDTSWLAKSLHNEVSESVLAKDANLKSDDWYEIYDPKNPLNRRRREQSKRAQQEKWKKTKVID